MTTTNIIVVYCVWQVSSATESGAVFEAWPLQAIDYSIINQNIVYFCQGYLQPDNPYELRAQILQLDAIAESLTQRHQVHFGFTTCSTHVYLMQLFSTFVSVCFELSFFYTLEP
jgi:hypothetical protein